MAEVSATAEPDTPAKNMEATILALARLPGTQPITTRHSSRMSSMMPTRDISSPARINIGTAINVKLLIPWKICWNSMLKEMPPQTWIVAARPIAMAKAIGTPSAIKKNRNANK